ncbi:S1PR1 [Branchiostoma lanceolatum]|uniref:S1PR1 protein n=1 Tax=Branchiostoma lanceolatum TaxID=7740 RepID=A0A8K0AGT6_BRALA|nr:S1PR1 [Branchiostoma lanceolatum]
MRLVGQHQATPPRMRLRRRRSTTVLLLYYIQVGRALTVGSQTDPEVYSLCNTTWTNNSRLNNERFCNSTRLFNSTRFLDNSSFFDDKTFSKDTWIFSNKFYGNHTKPEWVSANESVVTPPPDIDYEASWEDMLFIGLLAISALVGTVGNAAVILAFCLYRKVRTTANAFILNTSVWDLLESAVVKPLFISSMMSGLPNCGQSCCAFIGPLFYKNVVLSLYWVVVFAISAFYIRIYLHVRKSTMAVGQHLGHSPQQVSLQAVKRTKHMFYIFFTFLTLTCPVVVMNYADFYATFVPKAVFFIIIAMYYWNSAVNPIIYTWTLKEFRQGFKSMVRCRRQIVPNPPAAQPTVSAPRTSRLTISNQVAPAEPIATIPVVDT